MLDGAKQPQKKTEPSPYPSMKLVRSFSALFRKFDCATPTKFCPGCGLLLNLECQADFICGLLHPLQSNRRLGFCHAKTTQLTAQQSLVLFHANDCQSKYKTKTLARFVFKAHSFVLPKSVRLNH